MALDIDVRAGSPGTQVVTVTGRLGAVESAIVVGALEALCLQPPQQIRLDLSRADGTRDGVAALIRALEALPEAIRLVGTGHLLALTAGGRGGPERG